MFGISKLGLIWVVFAMSTMLMYVRTAEADPVTQPPPPDIAISPPNCKYELIQPGGIEEFDPESRKFLPQETDVALECAFDLRMNIAGTLRVLSDIDSWKGKVVLRSPGGPPIESDISGPESRINITAGSIRVDVDGKTPKGIGNGSDPSGYRWELHRAEPFTLIDIDITAAGASKGVVSHELESASVAYIQATDTLETAPRTKAWDVAKGFLDEGFPYHSMRALPLGDTGTLWPWIVLAFVGGFASIILVQWGLYKKGRLKLQFGRTLSGQEEYAGEPIDKENPPIEKKETAATTIPQISEQPDHAPASNASGSSRIPDVGEQ